MSKWFEIGLDLGRLKQDASKADDMLNSIGKDVDKNAQSFKRLQDSIEEVIGTQDANAIRLVKEQQELSKVRQQLANLAKEEQTRSGLTQKQIGQKATLIQREIELRSAISELSGSISNNIKITNSAKTSIDEMIQSLRQMRDAYSRMTEEERNSDFGKELLSNIKKTDSELGKLRGSMGETTFSFRGISNQMRMMSGVFGNLPTGLQRIVVGLNGMTGAARAFIATPLGAIIAALVVVIQAFRTWIDKSEKGQMGFAKVSGYLGGVLKGLTDIVVKIGDALYDAFTKPQEAIAKLGGMISNFFKNPKESLQNLLLAPKNFVESIHEKGTENSSIKAEETTLAKERNKWEAEKVDLELKAQKNAKVKEEIRRRDLELTQKEIALAERKYKFTGSDEDLKKLTQLKGNRNTIIGSAPTIKVDKKDYTNELAQQKQALERANKDLELQAWQARIDAMPEGLKKTLEANKLAYTREEEQLKRQAEDRLKQIQENEKVIWESKDGKGKFTPTTTGLSDADKEEFDTMVQDAKTKQTLDDLKAQEEALKRFEDLSFQISSSLENDEVRKQNAIKKTYQEMRDSLDKMLKGENITKEQYDKLIPQIDTAERKAQLDQLLEGVNDYHSRLDKINKVWEEKLKYDAEENNGKLAEVIKKGQSEAIGALNAEFLTKSEDWQMLFGNLEALSVKSLLSLKEKIKKAMEGMNLDPASMKSIMDALDKVDKQVSSKNPFAGLSEGIKKYQEASDGVKKSDALSSISENIGSLGQITQSIFGEVVDGLKSFGVEMDEETEELLSNVEGMISGATQLAQGILTGNPVDIVTGGIKLLTSAINVFDSTSRKANQTIKANDAELDNLEKAYKRLERSIDDVYSSDKKEHIEQLKRVREKQQELIRLNIEAEKSKKKPDKEKIKAWENEITELSYQIEDLGKGAQDAIYGQDIKSAVEEFANAYADAWAKGNDKAKASKDIVKKMIKGMIMEAMKGDIMKVMPMLRAQLESFWADGIITQDEEAELQRQAEEITEGLDKKYKWADRFMSDAQSQGSASYGAYEKITQDQASSIDGRLTGIHMETVRQSDYLLAIDRSVLSLSFDFVEMKNIALDSWQELTDINKNTKQLYEMNERLGKIEKNTSNI